MPQSTNVTTAYTNIRQTINNTNANNYVNTIKERV